MNAIQYKSEIRPKGQITLPGEIRQYLDASEGDQVVFSVNESGQVVVEKLLVVPSSQAWFWTERWQKMEREAQTDIDAGRVERYDTVDEVLKVLRG